MIHCECFEEEGRKKNYRIFQNKQWAQKCHEQIKGDGNVLFQIAYDTQTIKTMVMNAANKAMRKSNEKNTVPEKQQRAIKISLLLSMHSFLFVFSLRIVWRFHFYEAHEKKNKRANGMERCENLMMPPKDHKEIYFYSK